MKKIIMLFTVGITAALLACSPKSDAAEMSAAPEQSAAGSIYDFTVKDIDGASVPLSKYKGKVVVIINTASKCGLTPQYADIEKFYKDYSAKGVVVLGFPANNFMGQEPGSDSEIKSFCAANYGVTFPMFSKISVKGSDIHPLYKYLTQKQLNGVDDFPVTWNFQKFVIGKDGKLVQSFSPRTGVEEEDFLQLINKLVQ
jgi:glutathione peroxidase